MSDAIYLDYQATTPPDPRVLAAMAPWYGASFANPHSSHARGRAAAAAVEAARAAVAAVLGAAAEEIVFTSGATESNNLAIKGAARFQARRLGHARNRIVTVATEHKCVLEACRDLRDEGFEVSLLPVGPDGRLELERVAAALDRNTALLSVMAVNNETGTIQDLAALGRLARECGALFHTDAAQGFGKIPLAVEAMCLDLVSISGHKIYAPQGVGALYVRRRPRVRLEPLFSGGGQERGLRSGTLPVALAVALGVAAEIAAAEMAAHAARAAALSRRFLSGLGQAGIAYAWNGSVQHRLPGCLNLSFDGVAALDLLEAVPELALSTGSACSAAAVEPSYVLGALGLDAARQRGGIRIGFGRPTTEAEIDRAVALFAAAVTRLREGAGPCPR